MERLQYGFKYRLHDNHSHSNFWNWRCALGQIFGYLPDFHYDRILSGNDLGTNDRLQEKQGHDRRY